MQPSELRAAIINEYKLLASHVTDCTNASSICETQKLFQAKLDEKKIVDVNIAIQLDTQKNCSKIWVKITPEEDEIKRIVMSVFCNISNLKKCFINGMPIFTKGSHQI